MSTYDRTSNNLYRHIDLQPFNPATDTLTVSDLHLSSRGMQTITEALAGGHLFPHELERLPLSFNAHAVYGEVMTASLPKFDFSDIRLGGAPKHYEPESTVRFKEEAAA